MLIKELPKAVEQTITRKCSHLIQGAYHEHHERARETKQSKKEKKVGHGDSQRRQLRWLHLSSAQQLPAAPPCSQDEVQALQPRIPGPLRLGLPTSPGGRSYPSRSLTPQVPVSELLTLPHSHGGLPPTGPSPEWSLLLECPCSPLCQAVRGSAQKRIIHLSENANQTSKT